MNKQKIVSVKLDEDEIAYFEAWKKWITTHTPVSERVLTVSVFLHDSIRTFGHKFMASLEKE